MKFADQCDDVIGDGLAPSFTFAAPIRLERELVLTQHSLRFDDVELRRRGEDSTAEKYEDSDPIPHAFESAGNNVDGACRKAGVGAVIFPGNAKMGQIWKSRF
jgi:hypothetical protein